ncbi:Tm-1-like ATP-binding domain-containing protein [Ramlibacter sp. AN1015]|uniref:Tm-1-like ATP-binding domain-containing protein n=1 Tax=Ramlibacter sp. AN1015 TaxID=3133428 RepID=UPI0030C607C0
MASVWVVGTWDTKAEELAYLCGLLRARGVAVTAVDVGTRSPTAQADIAAEDVAGHHPGGRQAVFGSDRGSSVSAMSTALCALVEERMREGAIAGMLGVGGSGGTSLIAPAMRLLPIGTPKLLVSTMAAGDVSAFVGVVDMTLMFPVTDIAGLNRLSRTILANAAHAMAGMVLAPRSTAGDDTRPALGCTMFGVTTPCVQALRAALADRFDVQVFHANGSGGRAMEALAASGLLDGIVDVTTTEVLQHIVGGVCDAGPGRLEAASRHGLPWIGSVGAMDMVNWFAPDTVPQRFQGRRFHAHNANVTLMRSTAEELRLAGRTLAERLNRARGPVRLLLPLHGLSALDAPGAPFHDPQADAALFEALAQHFEASDSHRLVEVPAHINDPAFAEALAAATRECVPVAAPAHGA